MKRLVSLALILVLLLTACGQQEAETQDSPEPTEAVAQVTPTEDNESAATPTEAPSTATPTQATEATATSSASASEAPVVEAGEAACRLESITEMLPLQPQPGIAAISSAEWQQGGGQEATIQIIEYGDFQ